MTDLQKPYDESNERTHRVAHRLIGRGVGPEQLPTVDASAPVAGRSAAAATDPVGADPFGGRVVGALAELRGRGVGLVPHLPVTRFLMERGPGFDRLLEAMLLRLPEGIDADGLVATLTAVIDRHDLLRARLTEADGGGLVVGAPGSVDAAALLHRSAHCGSWSGEGAGAGAGRTPLLAELGLAAATLDPAAGVVAQFVWFDPGPERAGRLLVALHRIVVDEVSWRVLVSDLATAWRHVREGRSPELAPASTSVRRWSYALVEESGRPGRTAELDLWRAVVEGPDPVLGARRLDPAVDVVATLSETRVRLPADVTGTLLSTLPDAFRCDADSWLLAGLAMALTKWRAARGVDEASSLIRVEGLGREEAAVPGADLSRTVGCLTSVFPVRLDVTGIDLEEAFAGGRAAGTVVKTVKEQLLALPDKGIGYGLLRHLNPETAAVLERHGSGQISFTYRGRSAAADLPAGPRGLGFTQDAGVAELAELGAGHDPRMPAHAELAIDAYVTDTPEGPRLGALFTAPEGVLTRAEVAELAALWCAALRGLARHAEQPGAGGPTPSDVPLVHVAQTDIDAWQRRCPGLEDIWPVSPQQKGLLLRSVTAVTAVTAEESGAASDACLCQYVLRLSGDVDPARLRRAAQAVLARHDALRAAFVPGPGGELVQLVAGSTLDLLWLESDLSRLDASVREAALEKFLADDLGARFDPARPPMLRMALLTLAPDRHELVLTVHRAVCDSRSLPPLVQDLLHLYATDGDPSALPAAPSYRDYLARQAQQTRQARQSRAASARARWRELDGVREPTLLFADADTDTDGTDGTDGTDTAMGTDTRAAMVTGTGTDTRADGTDTGTGLSDVPLPAALARDLPLRAAEHGVTLTTLVQGAWGILLSCLTGRQDVLMAAVSSGRPSAPTGRDAAVGMFLHTLPVRVRCAPGATVGEVLADLHSRRAGLPDRQHHGLADIRGDAGLRALCDTAVDFESFPVTREAITGAGAKAGAGAQASAEVGAQAGNEVGAQAGNAPGFTVTSIRSSPASHWPVTLSVDPGAPQARLAIHYQRRVLDRATADRLAARFAHVLSRVAEEPHARVADLGVPTSDTAAPLAAKRHRVPPATPPEQRLCALVARVLGVERVGTADGFLALGGDSRAATGLVGRIGKEFGVTVTVRAVFEARTIAELARTVRNASVSSRPELRRIDRSTLT
ncbi:condensation domain-containing protein [Streptomyces sp. NPDC017940]|uniref:condensation domain-containing protein n=1 Tax=Streptomyces sp. NPDC017940 TaxID=3365017 RepID=UPI00379AA6EF